MSKECEKLAKCEEMALIVEQSFWQKLNIASKIRLRIHLIMCKNCTDYKKDSTVLHRILCSFNTEKVHDHLDDSEKAKLKSALK